MVHMAVSSADPAALLIVGGMTIVADKCDVAQGRKRGMVSVPSRSHPVRSPHMPPTFYRTNDVGQCHRAQQRKQFNGRWKLWNGRRLPDEAPWEPSAFVARPRRFVVCMIAW